MRFAFGGIHIECSTYSRIRTRTEDFTVLSGEELSEAPKFAFLRSYAHPFFPTLYASAVPGGPVERATYESFKAKFLQSLKTLLPLDGLYLPMHGALYVEGMQDAEGDWISAARQVVGDDCLLSASYDLHGNLSRRVIDNIDMLSAYRTAPHIDVQETMQRAAEMLLHCSSATHPPQSGLGAGSGALAWRKNQHRGPARKGSLCAIGADEREARSARRFSVGWVRLGR